MKLLEERRGKLVHSLYSPVLRRSGRKVTRSYTDTRRPNTAAVLLGRFTQCERVHQLEREPTRCPSLEPASSSQRYKSPPWHKHAAPLVPFLVGPGYILSHGKNKYDVSANASRLGQSPEDEERKRLQAEASREGLITQLQQQISDLNLFLEEERLNHKQTKQKAEEYLRDRLEQLGTQHQEHTRQVKARHREEAQKQKSQLDSEFTEFQTTAEDSIRKLSKDVEHLQGAFEAYKSCLQDEMQERWNAMEGDLKKECQESVQAATKEMKSQMTRDKATDRAGAVKEQRRGIDTLRKEHKKDMDNMIKKYAKEATTLERLHKTTSELTEAKLEMDVLKTRHHDKSDKLASATRTLTGMKVQLMDFEEQFQEKVTEVNDKYRYKLHDLMTQNSQLRLLYTDKCGQLFDEQSNSDTRLMLQVKAAKAAMESLIESKPKDNPTHEPGTNTSQAQSSSRHPRPSSAPGTPLETQGAHQGAQRSAQDIAYQLKVEMGIILPDHPTKTKDSDMEQNGQELFTSDDCQRTREDLPSALNS
ncbi:hypothetical protein ACOMHN_058882 [Nucella lapillus]